MALPALVCWDREVEETWLNAAKPTSGLEGRVNVFLFIPIEASSMRTPFREEALNYIYRTALKLSDNRLQSAAVLPLDYPDEEVSPALSLNLVVDGDWELVRHIERQLEDHLIQKSETWTESEWDDFCRNIHIFLVPTNL